MCFPLPQVFHIIFSTHNNNVLLKSWSHSQLSERKSFLISGKVLKVVHLVYHKKLEIFVKVIVSGYFPELEWKLRSPAIFH